MALTRADDGFHTYSRDALWEESWSFDWCAPGSPAGFARQSYHPNLGEVWLWIYLFVNGRTVVVRDHSVPLAGRWGRYEHRWEGLWWEFRPQEPLQAWSLQAEAFGIEVEDPAEFLRGEAGFRVPVGLDLSCEAASPPHEWVPGARFSQFVSWSGELIVGRSTFSLEGFGARDHAWGPRDWWSRSWEATSWTAGPDLAIRPRTAPGRCGAPERSEG